MAAAKRKRSSVEASKINGEMPPPPLKRRASSRNQTTAAIVNPDLNGDIIDGPNATRASPDNDINEDYIPAVVKQENGTKSESPLSDAPETVKPPKPAAKGRKKAAVEKVKEAADAIGAVVDAAAAASTGVAKKGKGQAAKVKTEPVPATDDVETSETPAVAKKPAKKPNDEGYDPEAEDEEEAGEEELKEAISRPPPVNSDYLPLPWKGRLGYACLNTYLRNSNPPVFTSRTCRIASILEHRHPLADPSQPEHPTKNRPDKEQPADIERGRRYVEALCLANVKDITKMVRWNHRYGIKFFRLSSEMFPFASHEEYGYKLAPFASEALAEAGKVIAELGHRVTTHPGQFTQLGSPRKSVIDNAIRDLDYHDELLSLLKLPEQENRDAVMILHLGGVFEGKPETLQRFRDNYARLSQSVKNRLVLENDDVCWTVHDLLPFCEELNIPFVLDYHHNNILFDSEQIREGTKDIIDLYPRIKATWDRKGIRQKMHYSEPTPPAITGRQRRKHNPRVATLPPCPPDMDLMIEAKDKEQAVFELMKTFKLPGYDTFNDIMPYTRNDDNKIAMAAVAKKARSKKAPKEEEPEPEMIVDDEVGMGGPEGRVYWPPGMEEWLRPKKREVKKKDPAAAKPAAKVKKEAAAEVAEESLEETTPAKGKANGVAKKAAPAAAETNGVKPRPKKAAASLPTSEESEAEDLSEDYEAEAPAPTLKRTSTGSRKAGGRSAKKSISYVEEDDMELAEA